MNVYTVHMRRHGLNQDSDVVLIKEGFSWTAFLFTVIWALYYRLWLMATLVVAAFVVVGLAGQYFPVSEHVLAVIQLGLSVVIGFLAQDIRRHVLVRTGFADEGVVVAANQISAEQRYFDKNPAMAQMLRATY